VFVPIFNITLKEEKEEKIVYPLKCNITKITPNGEVIIKFDSLVRPLEFYKQE